MQLIFKIILLRRRQKESLLRHLNIKNEDIDRLIKHAIKSQNNSSINYDVIKNNYECLLNNIYNKKCNNVKKIK